MTSKRTAVYGKPPKQSINAAFVFCMICGLLAVSVAMFGQAPVGNIIAYAPQNAPVFTGGATVNGALVVNGTIAGTSDINAGSVGAIYWATRSAMKSNANGNIQLSNLAGTSLTNLQLGGTTAATPELLISGNTIGIRGADGTLPLFAALPACAAGTAGQMAWITDSSTITFGATIAGAGANKVLAICDGSNWTVH